ncbi:MAG: substrate-binding domain-containing protein [Gammaproteobacteria bacterium]|nr:substrate-binding domain-containing protein [Gammaproteobacteria bacterium]
MPFSRHFRDDVRGRSRRWRPRGWPGVLALAAMLAALPAVCLSRAAEREILLAITTSIEDSGLVGVLIPAFERRHRVMARVIAVGSGQALRLGRNGDVDALLLHAPEAEERFVREGWGVGRRLVMRNDFILLGPGGGLPAADDGIFSILRAIAAHGAAFVSRGDNSGTHQKELALWRQAGVAPRGDWYLSVGQGMAASLLLAVERQAYVLSDRGTYLALGDRVRLQIRAEGDPALHNPYHVIAVNPERHPHVRYDAARLLIGFLVGSEGQALIGNFRLHGQLPFYPAADRRAH